MTEMLYEFGLREPLKNATSEKCTVGLNGFVEFEMFSEPHVTCGEMVPRKDRDCYSS